MTLAEAPELYAAITFLASGLGVAAKVIHHLYTELRALEKRNAKNSALFLRALKTSRETSSDVLPLSDPRLWESATERPTPVDRPRSRSDPISARTRSPRE